MDSINRARLAQGTGDSNLPGGTSLAQGDWEKHRKTITRLYCDEKLPLKKVRAILAQQHGFRATYVKPITPHHDENSPDAVTECSRLV